MSAASAFQPRPAVAPPARWRFPVPQMPKLREGRLPHQAANHPTARPGPRTRSQVMPAAPRSSGRRDQAVIVSAQHVSAAYVHGPAYWMYGAGRRDAEYPCPIQTFAGA